MLWFLTTDLKWRRLLMFPQFADKEIKIRVVKLLAKNHWPSMSEPKSACVHACLLSHLSHVQPLQPYGLQPTRLPCLWDSSGKNTGVGWHVLLQGIFLTQRLNVHLLCLLHWQAGSLPLAPSGTPQELSYDPAIPHLGIYWEKMKNLIQKDICTPIFIAALFTIAKTWKQPTCPSTEDWFKEMWQVDDR